MNPNLSASQFDAVAVAKREGVSDGGRYPRSKGGDRPTVNRLLATNRVSNSRKFLPAQRPSGSGLN